MGGTANVNQWAAGVERFKQGRLMSHGSAKGARGRRAARPGPDSGHQPSDSRGQSGRLSTRVWKVTR